MPRDSGGTYSSPSGNFVSGTVISSSVMNTKLTDLGAEITDSLSRSGEGGMLARLRGVDGSSALPAYAFTDETTLGFYRAGSGDLRASTNGTDLLTIKATGLVTGRGLTITQANSNTAGLTVTGAGTGAGVTATGGATGVGGSFTGGASGADGLTVAGTGSGGHGITVSAGTTTGRGLNVTAGAYGAYIRGGIGLNVVGTSTVGAEITGAASSAGAVITGGSNAVGAQIAAGTAATGADPTNALELTNGNLKLSGTAPNSTESLANTITPADIAQVTGTIELTGANTASVTRGKNITSATINAGSDTLVVTYATAFANDDYTVVMGANALVLIVTKTTTTTAFQFFAPGSATAANLDDGGVATGLHLNIACYGSMS